MSKCRRCEKEIPQGEYEVCWMCQSHMCYECWDKFGDCCLDEETREQLRQLSTVFCNVCDSEIDYTSDGVGFCPVCKGGDDETQ